MIRPTIKAILTPPPFPHVAVMMAAGGSPLVLSILKTEPGQALDFASPLAISGLVIAGISAVLASAHTLLIPVLALFAAMVAGVLAVGVAVESGNLALYGVSVAFITISLAGTVLWQLRHPTA